MLNYIFYVKYMHYKVKIFLMTCANSRQVGISQPGVLVATFECYGFRILLSLSSERSPKQIRYFCCLCTSNHPVYAVKLTMKSLVIFAILLACTQSIHGFDNGMSLFLKIIMCTHNTITLAFDSPQYLLKNF